MFTNLRGNLVRKLSAIQVKNSCNPTIHLRQESKISNMKNSKKLGCEGVRELP